MSTLSDVQVRVLAALADAYGGELTGVGVHQALRGRPIRGWRACEDRPLTGSERASLGRSLVRLEHRGLVRRVRRGTWSVTSAGRAVVEAAGRDTGNAFQKLTGVEVETTSPPRRKVG